MGCLFLYKCSACPYEAQVDGDYSRGFERFQVTIECLDCTEVTDVELDPAVWRENCQGAVLESPDVQCKTDPNHQARTWDGCCPKCGEKMERVRLVMDWD